MGPEIVAAVIGPIIGGIVSLYFGKIERTTNSLTVTSLT